MRMSFILPIAAALGVVAAGWSGPAPATTLKGALAICNKHGNCEVRGGKGGANIRYGTNYVWCPYGGGNCSCIVCTPRTKAGGVKDQVVIPKKGGGKAETIPRPSTPKPVVIKNSNGPAAGGSWQTTNSNFRSSSSRSGGGGRR